MGWIDVFTGGDAADAANSAAKILSQGALDAGDLRAEGGREAFDFFNQQLSPFASSFDVSGLNRLASDPQAQLDFLSNNPLFEALKNQARESTFRSQSARGALGSSATDEILQNAFLTRGNELITNQINRQLPLYQGALNASTNLSQFGGNALTGIKEALAAALEQSAQAKATGKIGAANARSGGLSNIVGLGSSILSGGLL